MCGPISHAADHGRRAGEESVAVTPRIHPPSVQSAADRVQFLCLLACPGQPRREFDPLAGTHPPGERELLHHPDVAPQRVGPPPRLGVGQQPLDPGTF
ncbi:MAG: hypothetical protein JWO38_1586, partial [Gemmataceae bacterium]|nr:hypothetical protein [Gemmataceae bacterium]